MATAAGSHDDDDGDDDAAAVVFFPFSLFVSFRFSFDENDAIVSVVAAVVVAVRPTHSFRSFSIAIL